MGNSVVLSVIVTALSFACMAAGLPSTISERAPCAASQVNSATLNLIKSFSTFRPSPYYDPFGTKLVGYGHQCGYKDSECSSVASQYGAFPITQAEGEKLLRSDLAKSEDCLAAILRLKLNANQYGAMVSFTASAGCEDMQRSFLVALINEGGDPNRWADQELPQYTSDVSGEKLPSLETRRAAELKLFKTPTSNAGYPKSC